MSPSLDGPGPVVGVNRLRPLVSVERARRVTGVIVRSIIEPIDEAVGPAAPNVSRHALSKDPKPLVALSSLGACEISHIVALSEDTRDAPGAVDQGLADHVDQPFLERTVRRTSQADQDSISNKTLPGRVSGI